MLSLLSSNPLIFIILVSGLIIALSFHEAAHAYVAHWLGDDTPKHEGRLTLNPLAHLDPIGTIALIVFRFGWGKPVHVNPRNFKNPVWGNLATALAGPMTNFILAIIFALIGRIIPADSIMASAMTIFVSINILLAFFNLLPIPPLDGSKLLGIIVGEEAYYEIERFGPIILLAFIFFVATYSPFYNTFFEAVQNTAIWLMGY